MNSSVPLGDFLTRTDRRRVKTLSAVVGRVTDGDARFFERFPERRHRVRLASAAEVETDAILKGEPGISTESGSQWVTIVKQLGPGVRLRAVERSIGRDGNDFDLSEEMARWAYDQMVVPGSYMWERERQMVAALARMGAPR